MTSLPTSGRRKREEEDESMTDSLNNELVQGEVQSPWKKSSLVRWQPHWQSAPLTVWIGKQTITELFPCFIVGALCSLKYVDIVTVKTCLKNMKILIGA